MTLRSWIGTTLAGSAAVAATVLGGASAAGAATAHPDACHAISHQGDHSYIYADFRSCPFGGTYYGNAVRAHLSDSTRYGYFEFWGPGGWHARSATRTWGTNQDAFAPGAGNLAMDYYKQLVCERFVQWNGRVYQQFGGNNCAQFD